MKLKISLVTCITSLLASNASIAQHTFVPLGSEEVQLIERLETKIGQFSNQLFLTTKPLNRESIVKFLSERKSEINDMHLTNADMYQINRAISISGEWVQPNGDGAENAKHSLFNVFYTKKPDFLHLNGRKTFFALNPVASFYGLYENNSNGTNTFRMSSTQGAEARVKLFDRIGAYGFFTHNYDNPVGFYRDYIEEKYAMPGAGRYYYTNNDYTYLLGRGYVNLALIRNHIDISTGYDKHFIGDGFRTMFLSDFSEGATFVKLNSRVWKLNYQNLYLKLNPHRVPGMAPINDNKFATVHHLSMNIGKKFNFGLFESVVFGRPNNFEFGYMNPIIFYRAVERYMGSPDKITIGLNAKAIVLNSVNVYGQFLINEFSAREFFASNGYFGNKWGVQLGAKYYDAFSLENLNLQMEFNCVRPYTFSANPKASSDVSPEYSHYNQPLAHVLGSGFWEVLFMANYRPVPKLSIDARWNIIKSGIDTGGLNYGNNIFLDYFTAAERFGVGMVNGVPVNTNIVSINFSYELKTRLHVDVGAVYRDHWTNVIMNYKKKGTTTYVYAGLRLNLSRRDYAVF